MKRFILIVLLVALVGSMAYAVMLTRSNSNSIKIEKKEKAEPKEVKKKRGCGFY